MTRLRTLDPGSTRFAAVGGGSGARADRVYARPSHAGPVADRPARTAGSGVTLDIEAGRSDTVRDPIYPEYGNAALDVLAYRLDLDWDPDTRELSGVATLTIRAITPVSAVQLDFSDSYTVDDVTVDGAAVTSTWQGDDIAVPKRAGAPTPGPRSSCSTTGGRRRCRCRPSGATSTRASACGWPRGGEAWTMQEPYGASTWYPVNDTPSDEAVYDVTRHRADRVVRRGARQVGRRRATAPASTRSAGSPPTRSRPTSPRSRSAEYTKHRGRRPGRAADHVLDPHRPRRGLHPGAEALAGDARMARRPVRAIPVPVRRRGPRRLRVGDGDPADGHLRRGARRRRRRRRRDRRDPAARVRPPVVRQRRDTEGLERAVAQRGLGHVHRDAVDDRRGLRSPTPTGSTWARAADAASRPVAGPPGHPDPDHFAREQRLRRAAR